MRRLIGVGFVALLVAVLGAWQASGGLVEFWTARDVTVRPFGVVDLDLKTVPYLDCQTHYPNDWRVPGLKIALLPALGDTIRVTFTASDPARRCLLFINNVPGSRGTFPGF